MTFYTTSTLLCPVPRRSEVHKHNHFRNHREGGRKGGKHAVCGLGMGAGVWVLEKEKVYTT